MRHGGLFRDQLVHLILSPVNRSAEGAKPAPPSSKASEENERPWQTFAVRLYMEAHPASTEAKQVKAMNKLAPNISSKTFG